MPSSRLHSATYFDRHTWPAGWITSWLYDHGLWRYDTRMTPAIRSQVYVPYVRDLRSAPAAVERVNGLLPTLDNLYGESGWRAFANVLRRRGLLIVTNSLAL